MLPGLDTLDCCDAPSPAVHWLLTNGHDRRVVVATCGCGQRWRGEISRHSGHWKQVDAAEAQVLVDSLGSPPGWAHDPMAGVDMGLYTDP